MKTQFKTIIIKLFIILVSCNFSSSQFYDYYWREYTGEIPHDAFVGGIDVNGKNTYIGQGYKHGYGIFIGRLTSGVRTLNLAAYGSTVLSGDIKILCTKYPSNLKWVHTASTTFQLDMMNIHAVIGGYDHKATTYGMLYVGRRMLKDSVVFGHVLAYSSEPIFYYPNDENKELVAKSYEVLICDPVSNNFNVRQNTNGTVVYR